MSSIEKKKEKFKELVDSNINRDGITNLVDYLEKEIDFFTSPSSSKYHNNFEGGLVQHSINVLYYALMLNKFSVNNSSSYKSPETESIYIVALFHDVCKANFYKYDKRWMKNEDGKWVNYYTYVIDEKPPYLDHANKSLFIISKYVDLKDEEAEAIRWHMGAFDPSAFFMYPYGFSFRNAADHNNLVALISSADISASLVENVYDYQKGEFLK